MAYGSVYLLTNTVSGKRYVGMTVKTPQQRFHEHASLAAKATAGYTLAKAIRKYGKAAFAISTLATADCRDNLIVLEQKYIAKLQPEYNSTSGGDGCYSFIPEVAERMRNANRRLRNKPVVCLNTGVVYPSATVAAAAFGLAKGDSVAKVCRGDRLSASGLRFAWHLGVYEGDPGAAPDGHVPVELCRYSTAERDYSKYKTPEFSSKIRAVMLARKQVPTDKARLAQQEATRQPVRSTCGLSFVSKAAAAAHFGVCKTTITRAVRAGRPVGPNKSVLTLEV